MDNSLIKELGSAILHWLSFQRLCGRSALLSESYLAQPVGEFLLYHHSGDLDSEVTHPNLSDVGQGGRPRQIDFCLFSRDKRRITDAFELKWVAGDSFSKERVVHDLLRLEALRIPEGQYVSRYFVIAGVASDFDKNFRNAKGNGRPRYNFFADFFKFDQKGELVVMIDKLRPGQRQACDGFATNYGAQLPNRFTTTLQYGTEMDKFKVFIWKVASSQNRRPIKVPTAEIPKTA